MLRKSVWLTIWVFAFQLIAFFIHQFFHLHLTPWYQHVVKSPLHPPEIIFPVVWSTLYVMITLSGWLLWQARKEESARTALIYYFIQIILIWAWPIFIFALHWTGIGFFLTIAIFIATFMTIIAAVEKHEFAATLLAPTLLWLLYVAFLCGFLWWQN